jgi:hypothetical protein
LPGEWARPESHTLPKPNGSTSHCFLPPLHRVPAHLPSQNPRGCTFCSDSCTHSRDYSARSPA